MAKACIDFRLCYGLSAECAFFRIEIPLSYPCALVLAFQWSYVLRPCTLDSPCVGTHADISAVAPRTKILESATVPQKAHLLGAAQLNSRTCRVNSILSTLPQQSSKTCRYPQYRAHHGSRPVLARPEDPGRPPATIHGISRASAVRPRQHHQLVQCTE